MFGTPDDTPSFAYVSCIPLLRVSPMCGACATCIQLALRQINLHVRPFCEGYFVIIVPD